MIQKANLKAMMAGYNFAVTLELSRKSFVMGQVERPSGTYRQVTGIEATSLALATLATKTQQPLLLAGYPITPASNILHECAKLKDFGVNLFQAEDEIAAIGACVGASFGGHLAVTCTSGPGFDLKSETLGFAVMAELPLVVINVMRGGPSTGLPTKTEQSDLNQALYGRHGEAPLPVIAAITSADCFHTIIRAFEMAVKYMTPVVVLMDAYLANAAEPWKIPNQDDVSTPNLHKNRMETPYQRDEYLSRSWNVPGVKGGIHQVGGLEKEGDMGHVSYQSDNHQNMIKLRARKIQRVADDYLSTIIEGSKSADTVVVGWGSTYSSIQSALLQCEDEQLSVAHIHLRHLNPLPSDLKDKLRKFKQVIVAELNQGQLCELIRARYLIDAQLVSQTNGLPFSTNTLVDAIKGACYE